MIFVLYVFEYDAAQYSFALELLYDDLRFVNLVAENQSIFALSLIDSGSKILPHVSVYLSLRCISFLIQTNKPQIPDLTTNRGALVAVSRATISRSSRP